MEWPSTPVSLALFVLIGMAEVTLVDQLCLEARNNAQRQGRPARSRRLRDIMAREMRHRIANQLHLTTAMLECSQIRNDGGEKVRQVLDQAIRRISSIACLQRIIDDKTSCRRGLAPLLRDVLDDVFHDVDVAIQVRAAPVALPDHHVRMICLIVIEAAMNSSKHTFRHRHRCQVVSDTLILP